jgi:putative phosphoesterase
MSENLNAKKIFLIGIISDTHGRLPQSVSKAFQNSDLIIHAGDIGDPEVIDTLAKIAPLRAVRGNMDTGQWARRLQQTDTLKIGNKKLLVIHDVHDLNRQAPFDKCHVVIHGHTHRPQVEKQQGILFVNPGSAVQPRYGYPPSVAVLEIKAGTIKARLIDLTG